MPAKYESIGEDTTIFIINLYYISLFNQLYCHYKCLGGHTAHFQNHTIDLCLQNEMNAGGI